MSHYLNELNEEQLAAVTYDGGPSLVVAGAGSGKTRVLTCKIAHLLDSGLAPWNILALTFTNKAAREMKDRIARQVGEERARRVWMGTFHSVFLRILHSEAERLGFTTHFTIYDAADSKSLLHTIIKELGLDDKTRYKPSVVQGRISFAKNRLVGPDAYAARADYAKEDAALNRPAIGEIYRRYANRCRQADAMDFDDLLYYTYRLFNDHADVLARYRELFRFVLVDEYQDTNYAQHAIVRQLAGEHKQVFVVGDDAQSIYSFRGAEIDNMLHFTKDFPGTRTFKLQRNYRSTQAIVRAANSLIGKNRSQIPKEVYSEGDEGRLIEVIPTETDTEEAHAVATRLIAAHRRGKAFDAFAILYRTHAQSRVLEETLRRLDIPYRIYGGLSFYQRKEIKDVIAYLRLAVNPRDEEALKRVINYPARGIGNTTIAKLTTAAATYEVSLWDIVRSPATAGVQLASGTQNRLAAFRQFVEQLGQRATGDDAYAVAMYAVKQSGIDQDLRADDTPEGKARVQNIEELLNAVSEFCSHRRDEGDPHTALSDFLSEVSLLTDADQDNDEENLPRVTLMTVHSAKGLEFDTVFVIGLEDGLFPGTQALDSTFQMEEERRLFYVAITRAERECYLTYARTRRQYGKINFSSRSRFLADIDKTLLVMPEEKRWTDGGTTSYVDSPRSLWGTARPWAANRPTDRPQPPRRPTTAATPTPDSRPADRPHPTGIPRLVPMAAKRRTTTETATAIEGNPLRVGMTIRHERFGTGRVIAIDGAGKDATATVHFPDKGDKRLMLRFASYKIMENE